MYITDMIIILKYDRESRSNGFAIYVKRRIECLNLNGFRSDANTIVTTTEDYAHNPF